MKALEALFGDDYFFVRSALSYAVEWAKLTGCFECFRKEVVEGWGWKGWNPRQSGLWS